MATAKLLVAPQVCYAFVNEFVAIEDETLAFRFVLLWIARRRYNVEGDPKNEDYDTIEILSTICRPTLRHPSFMRFDCSWSPVLFSP